MAPVRPWEPPSFFVLYYLGRWILQYILRKFRYGKLSIPADFLAINVDGRMKLYHIDVKRCRAPIRPWKK